MTDDSLSELIAQLQSDSIESRTMAAEELATRGEAASPVAVALVDACSDASEEVREWAVAALEAIGPPPEEDIAELCDRLRQPQLDVAYWAATLLGRLKTAAAPAVDALAQSVASHPEAEVRCRCAWALSRIGTAARTARAVLQQAAQGDHPRLARLARQALDRIGD